MASTKIRERHTTSHDGSKFTPSTSGHCQCMCAGCWIWYRSTYKHPKTKQEKPIGACICQDCPCGGSRLLAGGGMAHAQ